VITFVFDNNAIQHLINNKQYLQIKPKIIDSLDRRINKIYISQLVFYENLNGIREETFDVFSKIYKEIYELNKFSTLLLCPGLHFKQRIKLDQTITNMLNNFFNRLILFINRNNYTDFFKIFSQYQNDVYKITTEMKRSLLLTIKNSKRLLNDKSKRERKEFLGSNRSDVYKMEFYKNLLKATTGKYLISDISIESFETNYPSLKYYIDFWRVYAYKILMQKNMKADRGDNFDPLYLLYLDICDYLVTDDNPFIVLVNEIDNEQLKSRVINTDEFLKHINVPFFINQSPISNDNIFDRPYE